MKVAKDLNCSKLNFLTTTGQVKHTIVLVCTPHLNTFVVEQVLIRLHLSAEFKLVTVKCQQNNNEQRFLEK